MQAKRCFVAMPIKSEASAEYSHFKALYEEIIRPTIVALDYDVTRSDEIQKAGAITKDIVLHLAEVDLVVVDLTDLNPNVFYELGVRHSLRGQGTVMIVDELRTDNIPFDLSAYRVIKFRGDLPGFGKLRRELIAFVHQLRADKPSLRDNPVHDWLPSLPMNALEAASGTAEGSLRERLANAERRLTTYEDRYGPDQVGLGARDTSPLAVVMAAMDDANEGNLPGDLLKAAEDARAARDTKAFLSVARRVLERRTVRLSANQFLELAQHALSLGLRDVTDAILEYAGKVYPKDTKLRIRHLASLGHSDDLSIRARVRPEIMTELGIAVTSDNLVLPDRISDEKEFLFGILLDTYYHGADADRAEALRLAEAAATRFSNRELFARHNARALEEAGRADEALKWYQRALWCPDVSDGTAIWLGNELHNKRRRVDATEAYLFACVLDPDDANGFSQVADEIAWTMKATRVLNAAPTGDRELPAGVDIDTFHQAAFAAVCCAQISDGDIQRVVKAAKRLQVQGPDKTGRKPMSLAERVELASTLYNRFKSSVTSRELSEG